ncbi:MAG: hypothetical protein OHK0013_44710 [Sandaracinaceae bacterium]
MWLGALISLVAHSVSCAPLPDEALAVQEEALLNGATETAALGAATFSAVMSSASCTYTFIAPDWLITAAHCVRGWSAPTMSIVSGEKRRPRPLLHQPLGRPCGHHLELRRDVLCLHRTVLGLG